MAAMMTPCSLFSGSDPRVECALRESYAAAAVASRGAGHAKKMKSSALAWDEELGDKEKQLCCQGLFKFLHAALILELCMVSVLLIAAITIKSVL